MNQQARVSAEPTHLATEPLYRRVLQRRCACGSHVPAGDECASCAEKKRTLQRRTASEGAMATTPTNHALDRLDHLSGNDFSRVPSSADGHGRTDASSGRSLEATVASRYRPGLGSLVDRVRVHHDSAGDALARREGAVAVTSGADIYFAAHMYQPNTATGRNLLAHELAHVWQQHRADGPPAGYQSRPGDRYEQEADRIADSEAFSASIAQLVKPASSVRQRRTAAEQIASILREAVEGWGTDEEAIFNALAGRTPAEIAAIEVAYRTLSGGEELEVRLRDELSGEDLSRAMSLLRGESAATEAARQFWNAVEGMGTNEEAIYAAVAGRAADEWQAIQDAYRQMANEALLTRLQDELTASEWTDLQTLLPGATGGAVTAEDRATVIANQIEAAVSGPGTDEEAIYSALTGRTDAELREIERRFRLLTGEDLDARLRDELTAGEYEQVQQLLHPLPNPEERLARALREAMQGPGTHERGILAILTDRPAAELQQIRTAYQRLYGEALADRLREELSGAELAAALQLEQTGVLAPEDEIYLSVQGPGTDEERLFAVLTEISTSRATIMNTIDQYAAKGYGDMLADIRADLSGADLDRAMELLHGLTPSGTCSAEERATGLEAVSGAVSLAQNAVSTLGTDIAAGSLSGTLKSALENNFNPGGASNAVNVALAGQVQPVFNNTRTDLLTVSDVTCGAPAPCVANPSCSSYTYGWTYAVAGETVRLCPAFFTCLGGERPRGMLHEFVHHTGIRDKFYHHDAGFSTLTPMGDGSAADSLDNADSYAHFAKDVS